MVPVAVRFWEPLAGCRPPPPAGRRPAAGRATAFVHADESTAAGERGRGRSASDHYRSVGDLFIEQFAALVACLNHDVARMSQLLRSNFAEVDREGAADT